MNKVKVKFTLELATNAQRVYSFLNLGARWGGWLRQAPATLPPGKTQHPLYRRLGGPQGRSGWVQKNKVCVPCHDYSHTSS